MNAYRNLGGKSGVRFYEFGEDYIKVKFSDGAVYLYTYSSAGQDNIEHMKRLAKNGTGLNSFIMKVVRDSWESKS
jgi:hypothetical protein